jgi:4-hydroxy-3-methylbut-2-en-1-yl diphosphate synthase IspG/GcpE
VANYSPEKDVVELNVAVIGVVLNGPAHYQHTVYNLQKQEVISLMCGKVNPSAYSMH